MIRVGDGQDSPGCFHIPKGVLVAESAFFRNVLRDGTIHEYWLPRETSEHFGLVQYCLLRHAIPSNVDSHALRAVLLLACSLKIKRLETLLLDRLVEQFTEDTRAFVLDTSCSKIPSQDQLESLIDANIPSKELDIRTARHLDCAQTAPHRLNTLWRRTPECHETLVAKTHDVPSLEDLPGDWKEAFAVWAHEFLRERPPGDRSDLDSSPTTTASFGTLSPTVDRKLHAPQSSILNRKARRKDGITKQRIKENEVAIQEIKSKTSSTAKGDHIYIYLVKGVLIPFRLLPKKKSGNWLSYPESEGFHIKLDQVTLETGGLFVAAIKQGKIVCLRFTEAADVIKFFKICQREPIERSE